MHSEIYRIAYKLHSEGKTPSVALIRARLATPTSLPVIVQALQQWKLTPELGKEVMEEPIEDDKVAANTTTAIEIGDSALEQRLDAIEQKLDRVLALLELSGKS